jgi:hypothetical protein
VLAAEQANEFALVGELNRMAAEQHPVRRRMAGKAGN